MMLNPWALFLPTESTIRPPNPSKMGGKSANKIECFPPLVSNAKNREEWPKTEACKKYLIVCSLKLDCGRLLHWILSNKVWEL
jgi:hypothetical protein